LDVELVFLLKNALYWCLRRPNLHLHQLQAITAPKQCCGVLEFGFAARSIRAKSEIVVQSLGKNLVLSSSDLMPKCYINRSWLSSKYLGLKPICPKKRVFL
jgi:hypothetical protein